MGVLNPGLLGLLGLGAIPVIIHLLNRRRYQVIPWPAMIFLLQAQVKTKQRLRMENLLLLLLRTLAVLLFALAATRPFLPVEGGIAGFQRDRRHLYILVDNSASMGYQEGLSTLLSRAVKEAKSAIDDLASDDPVTVVVACDETRRHNGRPLALLRGTRDHAKAREILESIPVSDARMDPAAALAEVLAVVEHGDPRRVLLILSDFQRNDWAPLESPAAETGAGTDGTEAAKSPGGATGALPAQLVRLEEARFELRGAARMLGNPDPEDLGIVSLAPADGRVPAEGVPTSFEIVVANHGVTPARPEVKFRVDGTERGAKRVELPARSPRSPFPPTVRVSFPWSGAAGLHFAEAEVSGHGDGLKVNNRRGHAFRVRDRVRVLAVDGDPTPAEGKFPETLLIETALSITRGLLPVDLGVLREADLPREEFKDADVVILANLDRVPDATWDRLGSFVRRGGGLWVFLGDRTDPSLWNEAFRRPGVDTLLPARLGERPRFDSAVPVPLDLSASEHPALKDLTDPRYATSFEPPLVSGWWPVREPLPEGSGVILRLGDLARSAFLIERRAGRGQVVLSTSSADFDWTGPSLFFAPFVQETVAWLASAGERSRDLVVHQPLVVEVGEGARNIAVLAEGQNNPDLEARRPEDAGGPVEGTPAITFTGTARAGRYEVTWEAPEPGALGAGTRKERELFAVDIDAREGDVARMRPEEIQARYPRFGAVDTGDGAGVDSKEALEARGDLTGWAIGLGILLLIAEMFTAAFFGRKRG